MKKLTSKIKRSIALSRKAKITCTLQESADEKGHSTLRSPNGAFIGRKTTKKNFNLTLWRKKKGFLTKSSFLNLSSANNNS